MIDLFIIEYANGNISVCVDLGRASDKPFLRVMWIRLKLNGITMALAAA